jgi:1-deoxyxylulose-5-phosphate synthase
MKIKSLELFKIPTRLILKKMNYYSLNGLDKQISQLIMGTMYFTLENYLDFVSPILDAFVEAGGNTLDTAKP